MPAVKPDYTAQVAKWAAVSTLVLTALHLVFGFVVDHRESEQDELSALLFVCGCLALLSAAISVITCVVSRLERRSRRADENST